MFSDGKRKNCEYLNPLPTSQATDHKNMVSILFLPFQLSLLKGGERW